MMLTGDNMETEDRKISATEYFSKGYNCAESILKGMGYESNIATAFGAGISRKGYTCGVVTGGILVINLRHGRKSEKEDREKAYKVGLEYINRFEKEFGSVMCYDLIGCDFRTAEGQKRYKDLNLANERCKKYVEKAIEILQSIDQK